MYLLYDALPAPYVPVLVTGGTSVYLCASSLQNVTVPHDLYSSLNALERSG